MKAPDQNDIEDLKKTAAAMRTAATAIDCFVEGVYAASGKVPSALREVAQDLEERRLRIRDLIEDLTEGEEGIDE